MSSSHSESPDLPAAASPVYFQCQVCGECCSNLTVPIEAEKAELLLSRSWVQERLRRFDVSLRPLEAGYLQVPMTAANTCVFLNEENLCLIQKHEGTEMKPEDCKRFPFAGVRRGDGNVLFDASASCKTVAERLLPALQPILPQAGEEPSLELLPLPERISKGLGLGTSTWVAHEERLTCIRPLFADPAVSAAQALKQAKILLLETHGLPTKMPERFAFPVGFMRWGPVWLLRKPYGTLSTMALITYGEYCDPKLFGAPFTLSGHDKIAWTTVADAPLKGFLFNLLTRKVLLAHGYSIEGLLSLACAASCLVRWYAATLALFAGRAAVEPEDVVSAVRLVERYYTGHQPRFLHKFRTLPASLLSRVVL